MQELSERAAAIHSGSVDPSIDNMLKVTSDGRKLGLDQRIINPDFLDEAGSKVNLCVDNILQVWQNGEADKLTQLVFCDISTPQAAPKAKQAVIAGNPLEAAALPAEENAPLPIPSSRKTGTGGFLPAIRHGRKPFPSIKIPMHGARTETPAL